MQRVTATRMDRYDKLQPSREPPRHGPLAPARREPRRSGAPLSRGARARSESGRGRLLSWHAGLAERPTRRGGRDADAGDRPGPGQPRLPRESWGGPPTQGAISGGDGFARNGDGAEPRPRGAGKQPRADPSRARRRGGRARVLGASRGARAVAIG